MSWYEDVKELNAVLSEAGGMARFRNNDGSTVSLLAFVFPAVLELAREVQEKCLLHFQMDKTEVFR